MRGSTLDWWSPEPGALVEWRLRDPDGARASSAQSTTGPSFLQRDHLMAAAAKRATGETNQAIAMIVTDVDERLDRDAMARALTAFVRRHDELRCWYDVSDAGPVRHVTPQTSIEFTTVVQGPSGTADALVAYMHSRIDTEAVFDHLPGFAFGAIDAGDRFAFYFVSDHSHTDGVSQTLALDEIFETYRHEIDNSKELELLPAGSYFDFVANEMLLAGQVTPDDARIDDWRRILKIHGGKVPRFPLDLGLSDGETMPNSVIEKPVVDGPQSDRCEERLRQLGASLQGCIFAALAATESALAGSSEFFTTTILAVRTPETVGTQGWLCNFAPIAFSVEDDIDFSELVVTASAATRSAREIGSLPVHAALAYLAAEGSIDLESGSPQMVSYFDLRRLPRADDPVKEAALILPGRGRTRNANMWINRGDYGIRLLTQIPDNETARKNITEYIAVFTDFITSFADGQTQSVRTG